PAQQGEATLESDDRADVLRVPLAEAREDLVVHLLELLADLLDLLRRQSPEGALDLWRRLCGSGHSGLPHSSISTGPSGALTHVLHVTPSTSITSPLRRSRTLPDLKRPTQVWQMPIRQPNGSSRPASSPATRIGLSPGASTSQPAFKNVIVPPSPSATPSPPMTG